MDDNDDDNTADGPTDRPTDRARSDAELIDLVEPAGRFMFARIRISVYGYSACQYNHSFTAQQPLFLVSGALSAIA